MYPGRLGFDAINAVSILRSGESDSTWTQIYFRYLQICTFNGRVIGLASIIGLALLVFSVRYFVNSLTFLDVLVRDKALAILFITPFVGIYGMTVDHNLQSTCGIILLIAIFLRVDQGLEINRKKRLLLVTAIIFAQMSFIGIFASLFIVLSFLLRKYWKFATFFSSMWIVILILGTQLQVSNNLHALPYQPFLMDIKCVVQDPDSSVTSEDWLKLAKIADKNLWLEPTQCSIADNASFVEEKYIGQRIDTALLWLHITANNPRTVILAHLQRAAVALPPILSPGFPNAIATDQNKPIGKDISKNLHSWSVALNDASIQDLTTEYVPNISRVLQIITITLAVIVNQNSSFWGWAGMWLTFIFILILGLRKYALFIATLPLVGLHLLMLIDSPVSDPRYVYVSTLIGITSVCLLVSFYHNRTMRKI